MLTMTAGAVKMLVAFSLVNTTPAAATRAVASHRPVPIAARAERQDWAGAYTLHSMDPEKVGPLVLHLLVERGSEGPVAVVIDDDGTAALSDIRADAGHFTAKLSTTRGQARIDLRADGDQVAGTLTVGDQVLQLTGHRID